jgi:glycolate dehydrogenase FAD-binding subunit
MATAEVTVERPGSPEEAAALLRSLGEAGRVVRPVGGRTKLDWGGVGEPVAVELETGGMAEILEHNEGDLTAVLQAGVPLAEAQARFAGAGQMLALDPPLGPASAGASSPASPREATTIGGLVATGDSGPLRHRYGGVRDLVLGISVALSDGVVAKAGSKVIKNVAGYDLGKLFTGSYGTLGLITECAFRLHPLPAATAVVTREVDTPAEVGRTVAGVLAAQVVPSGLEVDSAPGRGYRVSVLIEGTPRGVAGRVAALGGDAGPVPEGWGTYPWSPGEIGVKLSVPLSGVPAVLSAARDVAVRGSAGAGVLYAAVPAPDAVEGLRAAAQAAGGHAVVLTAPDAVRDGLDLWGPVPGLELMRRIKAQFDPDGRLAPGHFVGGI